MATVFTSCRKMDKETKKEIVETIIPSYADKADLDNAFRKVTALSKEERKAQETARGFKSFGTLAQEFYETINPEQFKSIEEIKAFVAEHSNYLQLIQDEKGEYTVEVVAYDNPYRYLANKDMEIKVDGKICKVTEEAVVDVHTEAVLAYSPWVDPMHQISKGNDMKRTSSILPRQKDKNTTIYTSLPLSGFNQTKSENDGTNRLDVTFSVAPDGSYPLSDQYWIKVSFYLRPYKRTLAWFRCNRSLTAEVDYSGYVKCPHVSRWIFSTSVVGYIKRGDGNDLEDGFAVAAFNSHWNDFISATESYRFKGSSGSNISVEWIYDPFARN